MRNRPALTLVELLVVVAILGMLIALLLPAMHDGTRTPARSGLCKNNLKRIGLALIDYVNMHDGEFPPAYTIDAEGNRLQSWRTLILPFLDEQALFDRIDLTKTWDDPANAEALDRANRVTVFRCPLVDLDLPPGTTTYLAVVGAGFVFSGPEPTSLAEITDGKDQTLLVFDAAAEHAVHWMSPQDADEAVLLSYTEVTEMYHPGYFPAAFVDGHVQSLDASLTGETRKAMITIAGGEAIADSDW